jgi:hypothetical protein
MSGVGLVSEIGQVKFTGEAVAFTCSAVSLLPLASATHGETVEKLKATMVTRISFSMQIRCLWLRF